MKHENFTKCKELVDEIDGLSERLRQIENSHWLEVSVANSISAIVRSATSESPNDPDGKLAHDYVQRVKRDLEKRIAKLHKELDPL